MQKLFLTWIYLKSKAIFPLILRKIQNKKQKNLKQRKHNKNKSSGKLQHANAERFKITSIVAMRKMLNYDARI